jgi:exodeoxyribonuclease V alpha subunit
MSTLQGTVKDITFQNEDNGFTVLKLQTDTNGNFFICVGTMPSIAPGETIRVQGEWESHKKFGRQFSVQSHEIIRPTTKEGIEMLLGSGLISNIGPVRAKRIIETFGTSTLEIMDNSPERLIEVPGIGKKFVEKITEAWERQKHLRSLMIFLQDYNVSVNLALRIYKAYKNQAKEKITQNPYCLVDEVWGVGFIKADNIAQKMGYSHDSYKRIRAGLSHVMQEAASNGHTFLPVEELTNNAAEILQVSKEHLTFSIDHSVETGQLIKDKECIYLPLYYHAEKSVAEKLREILKNNLQKPVDSILFEKWIENYQQKKKWQGDSVQLEAIRQALQNRVFLLTGGPGTGKTTVLQVIVSYFKEQNIKVALAAPTGRAAQRMGEVSGLKAQTIHRLLEFRPGAGGYSFSRNGENPIDAGVIILDEVSMVDILLMRHFLAAVKKETAIVFVGDDNQLPSVGAGNVLADFIKSKIIPHVKLTTVFRQAASSRIVTAAHEIIKGFVPVFTNGKSENCFFVAQDDPSKCLDTIVSLVSRRLPERYGYNPITDIQVISPMHKGVLGTQNLNELLQKALNANSLKLTRGQSVFCQNDKVMQIRNNYDMGVFNGDIGTVKEIVEDEGIVVEFDGRRVDYELKDLDELIAAYCISIHKSQGCEFNVVILPVTTQHFIMLQRNLLYTGITRAKKLCILIGTNKALSIAVKNDQAQKRYSRLAAKLNSSLMT